MTTMNWKLINNPKNKQPNIKQPKFKPPNCPSCKQNKWLEFDKGYYRRAVNILSTNKNINLIKKFLDKIISFLQDYHMLIKILERNINVWLILIINQRKI